MDRREIFICDCHSLEHQYTFWYDEEDNQLSFEPRLVSKGFWNRLKYGVAYIFGHKSVYGEWDDIIVNNDDVPKLIEILGKVKIEDNNRKDGKK